MVSMQDFSLIVKRENTALDVWESLREYGGLCLTFATKCAHPRFQTYFFPFVDLTLTRELDEPMALVNLLFCSSQLRPRASVFLHL